jgi:hypothetical protein
LAPPSSPRSISEEQQRGQLLVCLVVDNILTPPNMERTEMTRHEKALLQHATKVSKHLEWVKSVADEKAFDSMRGDIEKVRLYEENSLAVELTQLQIEHCKRMIKIGNL